MIPTYTKQYLRMNICGAKYFLPFEDIKEDEILEKTIKLLTESKIYERDLYKDRIPSFLSVKENEITMKCLYEGYDDYYPFSMIFTLFRLNDENDKKWLVAIDIEHEYGGLLDELLEFRKIPKMINSLGLIQYYNY